MALILNELLVAFLPNQVPSNPTTATLNRANPPQGQRSPLYHFCQIPSIVGIDEEEEDLQTSLP